MEGIVKSLLQSSRWVMMMENWYVWRIVWRIGGEVETGWLCPVWQAGGTEPRNKPEKHTKSRWDLECRASPLKATSQLRVERTWKDTPRSAQEWA